MENKSFFLSICYLLLPCCFSPVFVKASREAEILRGRSEQGSAAWELPLPPSDFDPPASKAYKSSAMHCTSKASKAYKTSTMHCGPNLTSLSQCTGLNSLLQYFVVCARGQMGYKNGNHADATLLPAVNGDEGNKKTASCTVNCFRADPVCGLDGITY
ncbi:hypothetical protein CY35_15G005100 [Sphagnum magellanicum]|nr:hypothetical protein CY35_15G005100 [Sphagnum magellanicum]